MHTAPPVRYPVKPSRLRWVCEGGVFTGALFCLVAWAYQTDPSKIQLLGGLCLCFPALACLLLSARSHPAGELVWDGSAWTLLAPAQEESVGEGVSTLNVLLDLQGVLLLRRRAEGVWRSEWIWLERRSAPSAWHLLRCAVYSRAAHEPSKLPTGH